MGFGPALLSNLLLLLYGPNHAFLRHAVSSGSHGRGESSFWKVRDRRVSGLSCGGTVADQILLFGQTVTSHFQCTLVHLSGGESVSPLIKVPYDIRDF